MKYGVVEGKTEIHLAVQVYRNVEVGVLKVEYNEPVVSSEKRNDAVQSDHVKMLGSNVAVDVS